MTAPASQGAVLVLDADTLPALAVARSLGRAGLSVEVASHAKHPLARHSRYSRQCLRYPSPLDNETAFLEWLEGLLATRPGLGMIVPVTERTVVPISRHLTQAKQRRHFAIPGASALEQVLDKALTADLAASCGVPQPRHWPVRQRSDLGPLLADLSFPLVVKPGRSIAESSGQRQSLTVRYAHSQQGLERLLKAMLPSTHVILQEYFVGEGVGVEVIAREGEILYAFQHRRLHEVPLTGGGSSLRVSEDLTPELLEASRKLIEALRWNGVAMVEFKWDPASRRFILIEINGRFWGSLPLATAAGADFPRLLWHLHQGQPLPPLAPYRRGLQCRKLSSDLSWLEAVLRPDGDSRLVQIPSRGRAVKDMLAMFKPSQHFDAQSLSDPLPGLVDLWRIATHYWRRAAGILGGQINNRWQRYQSRWSTTRRVVESANRILFVCYGNINRSALAEGLARHQAPESCPVQYRSAGFHLQTGRAPDERMVTIAKQQGVDISAQRSNLLTRELAEWADLILVMEVSQLQAARKVARHTPVHLLGGLQQKGGSAFEIPDPYNQPLEVYTAVYRQIQGCIDNLGRLKPLQLRPVERNNNRNKRDT